MKKSNNLLSVQLVLYLCFLPIISNAQNLCTGSLVIGNWDNYQSLDATNFNSASVGDVIQITATNIDISSAQLSLNNGSWADLAGSGLVDLKNESNSFVITSVMLAELQSNGILVRGKNFTLTSVDLLPGGDDYELNNAVWLGETVIGDWSGHQVLSSGTFVNAQVGNILRVKVNNLGVGAQGHLSNSGWGDLIDAEAYVDLSGSTYYEFSITSPMLSELQSNGLLIRGANYTVEGVYIINQLFTQVDHYKEIPNCNYWVKNKHLYMTGLKEGSRVRVYDINGKLVKDIAATSSSVRMNIYNQGVYILQVISADDKYVKKIIVE